MICGLVVYLFETVCLSYTKSCDVCYYTRLWTRYIYLYRLGSFLMMAKILGGCNYMC